MAISTNAELFTITNAIQGSLHPNDASDDSTDLALDYVNKWSLSQSEDSNSARADGKKKITLFGNKEVSFTVEAEVLTEGGLMFVLGATKKPDGTLVIGDTPNRSYTYTGIAKVKYANGVSKMMDVTIPNCTPEISETLDTSSIDMATFSIKFSCGTDDNGEFLTMKDHA